MKVLIVNLCFIMAMEFAEGIISKGVSVSQTWMEIGFVNVGTQEYVKVVSRLNTFTSPHIIMGMPQNGNEILGSGIQSAARVKDVVKSAQGLTSFYAKMFQPNDSWCNYTWWTPTVQPLREIHYMIMEEGHYIVSGAEFDISNRMINSHCSYNFLRHIWYSQFQSLTVRPGSLATTQTVNDNRFLSFREYSSNNNANGVTMYVQLHNYNHKFHPKVGDCVNGHYGDHYDNNRFRQAYTMDYESVAILGYSPNYVGSCEDGIVFEAREIDGITSDPRWLAFYWQYIGQPGVFGMVNSFTGADDVTVRSYNYSIVGVGVILREDQCDKQSVIHIQGEKMSLFVVGPVDLSKSPRHDPSAQLTEISADTCCICMTTGCESRTCDGSPTVKPSARPTVKPSRRPAVISSLPPTVKPSVSPTLSPSAAPRCSWVPNGLGLCRSGNDLATLPRTTLDDCYNSCLQAQYYGMSYATTSGGSDSGTCTVMFDLFTYVFTSSVGGCYSFGALATTGVCDSISWTLDAETGLGACNLKMAREATLGSCADPNTQTYDYNCLDNASSKPSLTPKKKVRYRLVSRSPSWGPHRRTRIPPKPVQTSTTTAAPRPSPVTVQQPVS